MPVETAAGIWDLVRTNPLGTDDVSQGDNHDRLIKGALLDTFPNITEPVTATAAEINAGGSPTGAMTAFGGQNAPSGWVSCRGQAIDRTDFADLYNVIGTTFGNGDGTTTFNVPDMRDKVSGGHGTNTHGSDAGKDTWTADDLPAHNHNVTGGAHTHDLKHRQSQAQAFSSSSKVVYDYENETYTATTESATHTHDVSMTGTGGDNRQATLYVNWIIKT